MKQLSLLLLCCAPALLLAQSVGKVLEGKTVKSAILGKDVRYTIYLPYDYASSERNYPAVYLLHGYNEKTEDDTEWLRRGEINRYTDQGIANGTITPMIIVMPDADVSFYINSYDGKTKYEDFFFKELIPAIEKTYRVKGEKDYRAIAGLSMGGHGTLLYALKHPDMFVAAAPFSAAVFTDEDMTTMPDEFWDAALAPLFGGKLRGKERLTQTWYDNSILKIIETKSKEDLSKVKYWIDCGDDDFLIASNCELNIALNKKGVPHEFRIRQGAHNWTYWRTGITDALQFISDNFREK
ncbi:MAG: esterase family protein [Saprospiraceae bacterium]|nr:esterase family protein [Saprospiraceae bacterium]